MTGESIMLTRINDKTEYDFSDVSIPMAQVRFPAPFASGLEYSSPARGTWNIVHTGMLVPEAHEIFVCAASCLRGVVLTAAEIHAQHRFSTVEIKEENLLDGTMEDLVIDGVSDVIEKLPYRPKAVLVYTSCVHHFTGCDLDMIYDRLRERYPDVDFTDCYMNPIMRKSGLTPDQLMRRQLYSLLKPRALKKDALAILGGDLPTDKESELYQMLVQAGLKVREIQDCKTYEEYQEMAESAVYLTYYPAAAAGAKALSERLGGEHHHFSCSFLYEEIDETIELFAQIIGRMAGEDKVVRPDAAALKARCEERLAALKKLVGDRPITIDYTVVTRPTSLARVLIAHGFNVTRLYLDGFTGEEKNDVAWLKEHAPELAVSPTVHAKMRVFRGAPSNVLSIGQKAAYFDNTAHFVNMVQGGGLLGYTGLLKVCGLIEDAYLHEKDTRALISVKGLGCEGCIG